MPPVPLAVNDLIRTREQGEAPGTRAPAQMPRGPQLPRLASLLRPRRQTGRTYQDPLFRRPDLVEDDYYRLLRQPRGR